MGEPRAKIVFFQCFFWVKSLIVCYSLKSCFPTRCRSTIFQGVCIGAIYFLNWILIGGSAHRLCVVRGIAIKYSFGIVNVLKSELYLESIVVWLSVTIWKLGEELMLCLS